ncbi:MAG: ABC transporter permease [Alphaproteobacteria bacterium]|nr:ABC transporter permease [Alphaproteobacteria bacterium]MCB9696700.1 ABC transporter permease [Alphaproteobacteria bacterium]
MSLLLDADPRYGRFGLRTECPRCGAHLPVNGPLDEVECAECGHELDVPRDVLTGMLERFEESWPEAEDKRSVTQGDLTWRITAEPLPSPLCPACGQTMEDRGGDEPLTCACGAVLPVDTPPKWLTGPLEQEGMRLLGGERDQRRDGVADQPVVLNCPACGAALEVNRRHQRVTPCIHCDTQVHLPDAVWRVLHPPRTVEPWIVRFVGESRPAAARRRRAEDAARKSEKNKEKAAQRAEREKRERAERERLAAEKAERDRAEAQARARRDRLWLVPTALCGVLALGCVAGMGLSAGAWLLAHTGLERMMHVTPRLVRFAGQASVEVVAAATLGTWLLSVVVAAFRGRNSVVGMLFWSGFLALFSMIPLVNLGIAWAHFRDREPTPSNTPNPRFTGWPLALLYVFAPPFFLLAFLAFQELAVTDLRRLF